MHTCEDLRFSCQDQASCTPHPYELPVKATVVMMIFRQGERRARLSTHPLPCVYLYVYIRKEERLEEIHVDMDM